MVRLHVLLDLGHEPVLVVFVELWLLHLCVGTRQQLLSIVTLSRVQAGLARLCEVVLRVVLRAQWLILEHTQIAVLLHDSVGKMALDAVWLAI